MKLKRIAVAILTNLLALSCAFPSYAKTPTYSSWDEVRASLGQEHAIGHSVIPTHQFWGPGKTGPTTPRSDCYFSASNLEVCKRTSSNRFIIRGNGHYEQIYYRYGDQYKAVCTYTSGYGDMTTNYTYYVPCMQYKYWVAPSRSGDFWTTTINGTSYNYKKDPAVQIGDGSTVTYSDSNHNGSDIYKHGVITFRIAHNPSAGYSSNDTHHWHKCSGCGGTVDYTAHTFGNWYSVNNTQHARKCNTCGKIVYENHKDQGNGTCKCGKVMHKHSYTELVKTDVAATCTSDGKGTYKCPSDSATTSKTIPKLGHTYGTAYKTQTRDCTHDEIWHKDCVRKDSTIEETSKRVAAPGHNWEWKWYPNNGVENAYMLQTCTRTWNGVPCGATQGEMNWTKHTTTYLSVDKDNNIELGRQTKTLNRGTIVHGNDIGEEDIIYDGVPYHYVGCEETKVDGDTTVKRFYQKTYYVISYDPNGGTGTMGTQSPKYDEELTLLPNQFSRVGYTWKGWSKEKTGDPVYSDQQKVTNVMERTDGGNTVTLYAIWEANKYTVHFDNTEGNDVTDITVTYDQPIGALPKVTHETLKLRSWVYRNYDANGDFTITDWDSTTIVRIPNDFTLYGDWKNKTWDVTFYSPSKVQKIEVLNKYTTRPPYEPKETGMNFLRWSTRQNGDEEFDFNTPITEDLNLYAVFEAGEYTINMLGTGTATRIYPSEIGNLPNAVQTGKTFEGWYYDSELTQKVNSTDQMPPNDITVYPKFSTGEYKLTLQGRTEEWTMHYGDAIPELPQLEQIGKEFLGWTYQSQTYHAGDTYEWDGDIELQQWWKTNQVTIIYPDGSAKIKDIGSRIGELPPAPDKQGQEFLGYVDDKGNWVTEDTPVEKDMTISYKYSASTIKLQLVDGDWTKMYQVEAGVTLTNLPTRSKDGYEFKGWSTYVNGPVTRGPLYNDTTLYASWETGMQTIELVDLGQTIKRKTGDALGNLPEAKKDGYRFKGWMKDGELVSSSTTVPAGGMRLTAWFEQIDDSVTDKVIVRYWSDGVRINTEDLVSGEILWDPGAPAVSNVDTRHFLYWSATPNGDAYEFGHTVATNVDLYAVWN